MRVDRHSRPERVPRVPDSPAHAGGRNTAFRIGSNALLRHGCYALVRALIFMRARNFWRLYAGLVALLGAVYAFQQPFREYPGIEYNNFPLPPDYQDKTEWTFARLMYPPTTGRFGGYGRFRGSDWRQGNSMWTQDYPRADRHFLRAMRRLTRVHARSVEPPVNLDDGDDVYNW